MSTQEIDDRSGRGIACGAVEVLAPDPRYQLQRGALHGKGVSFVLCGHVKPRAGWWTSVPDPSCPQSFGGHQRMSDGFPLEDCGHDRTG
jgi:hypothetical protein